MNKNKWWKNFCVTNQRINTYLNFRELKLPEDLIIIIQKIKRVTTIKLYNMYHCTYNNVPITLLTIGRAKLKLDLRKSFDRIFLYR